MNKKNVITTIDQQSLNSRHFAGMSEVDGIKALIANGFTTDEGWAKKAYAQCVADVKKADKPVDGKKD